MHHLIVILHSKAVLISNLKVMQRRCLRESDDITLRDNFTAVHKPVFHKQSWAIRSSMPTCWKMSLGEWVKKTASMTWMAIFLQGILLDCNSAKVTVQSHLSVGVNMTENACLSMCHVIDWLATYPLDPTSLAVCVRAHAYEQSRALGVAWERERAKRIRVEHLPLLWSVFSCLLLVLLPRRVQPQRYVHAHVHRVELVDAHTHTQYCTYCINRKKAQSDVYVSETWSHARTHPLHARHARLLVVRILPFYLSYKISATHAHKPARLRVPLCLISRNIFNIVRTRTLRFSFLFVSHNFVWSTHALL